MNQKGFAPILILVGIVLIVVIAGGAYYLGTRKVSNPSPSPTLVPTATSQAVQPTPISPSPDETANWKNIIYKSLSFKIPPIYQSGYLGSSSVFAIDPQPIPKKPNYGDFTSAFSIDLIKNKTLDQAKKEFLNQSGYTNKEISNITVDIVSGFKTSEILPAGEDVKDHHIYDVYLSVGQDLYHFNSFDLHISTEDQHKYFDQILSTFKFTQ